MTIDIPFDCKEILDDALHTMDSSSFDKFKNGLDKVSDIIKNIFTGLKDEAVPIGITIGAEVGMRGLSWLLKKFVKKAITKAIYALISAGFDALDVITLAAVGVDLIRGLTGTTLNLRLDKEIITNTFDSVFDAWTEELNKDRAVNCYRRHFLDYLKKENPNGHFDQNYVEEFLKNIMAVYKVIRLMDAIDIDEIEECMPCVGMKKTIINGKESYDFDISKNAPSYCTIDLSNSFILGFPTDKCKYKDNFFQYINKPYFLSGKDISLGNYNWGEVKDETGDACKLSNPNYVFCLEGDKNGCKRCRNAPLYPPDVPTNPPNVSTSNNLVSYSLRSPRKHSIKNKIIIIIIIIIICFLLYFLIKIK